ncbi:hypothetical protein JOC77_003154 [Peribacillus deserti]|uniref:Sporulation protein YjcZ n=1 Tax=Peribacillus deserti TaxID=673318 RepID=A0ABS2QKL2_9BACI|nr:hypothetical protein [Peribacillus deserti]
MKKHTKAKENSKIDTDDGWNRTFYGSPTIGGMVIVILLVGFILYQTLFT